VGGTAQRKGGEHPSWFWGVGKKQRDRSQSLQKKIPWGKSPLPRETQNAPGEITGKTRRKVAKKKEGACRKPKKNESAALRLEWPKRGGAPGLGVTEDRPPPPSG